MRSIQLALLLTLSAGIVSCGSHPESCSSASCLGCCDASGVCEPGATTLACGQDGAMCAACPNGKTCSLGACISGSAGGGQAGAGGGSSGTGGSSGSGGSQGNGGGSQAAGGGVQATGGGSHSNGGGVQATGGGSQSSGGGAQSSGGGSQSSGGGSHANGGGTPATGGGSQSAGGGSQATGGGTSGTGGGTTAAGGGTGSTCTPTNCTGCCISNICIPVVVETNTNCGHNGAACAPCAQNSACVTVGTSAGTCSSTPQGGGIGDPCNTAEDCSAVEVGDGMGGPAICQTQQDQIVPNMSTAVLGATYPGGYCTRTCYADTQCGTGLCGYYGGQWGEALNICYSGCTVDTDCRAGYACLTVSDTTTPPGVCIQSTLPDGGIELFDAGHGPARTTLGKDCTTDSQCQTETGYGLCLKGTLPDGGPSGYGTGSCTADCTMSDSDAWCMGETIDGIADGGATCDPVLNTDQSIGPVVSWFCVKGCNSNTDCKTGYHCSQSDLYHLKSCQPNCDSAGAIAQCGPVTSACLSDLGCYSFACNATTHDCAYP